MNVLLASDIKVIIRIASDVMNENKDWLIELDGAMGDGDLGLTMSTGFSDAADFVENLDETDIGKILMKAGFTIADSVPSTMGTLIASGFMSGGKVVKGKEELGLDEVTQMLKGFVDGIIKRGKAKPGEKTIIDSLYPAYISIQKAKEEGESLEDGISKAYSAAKKGLEDTKKMKSVHGRAAYYGEKSIGKQDPGATVGMLFLSSFDKYINKK